MTQSVTIRNIPDALARKLKARAERNHRSLQGEIMLILEQASTASVARQPVTRYGTVAPPRVESGSAPEIAGRDEPTSSRKLTIDEIWERGKRLGLSTPSDSTEIVRALRDERYGH